MSVETRSIKFKKWVGFFTIFAVNIAIITSLYFIVNHRTEKRIINDLGQKLNHIALSTVAGISKKDHKKLYINFRIKGQEAVKTPEFNKISTFLKEIQKQNKLATDVYTVFIPDWAPENMIFLAMSSNEPYLGNGTKTSPMVKKVYETKSVQNSSVYKTKEGEWISGAAPIFDKKGNIQGVLQADFRTDLVLAAAKKEAFKKLIMPILGLLTGVTISLIVLFHFLMRSLETVLKSNISDLVESSSCIESSCSQTTQFSKEIINMNKKQVCFIEETSTNLEEITSMSKKTANDTENAVDIANNAILKVSSGKDDIAAMIVAIQNMTSSNTKVMKRMDLVKKDMDKIVSIMSEITDKTNVINDIVFQTKLLSFNASVEAARAGEHGKGFAVLADEIANLASMSGKSSIEISDILSKGIKTVGEIIESTETEMEVLLSETESNISKSMKVGESCESSMQDISQNVSQVINLMKEVNQSIQYQDRGISGVNTQMQTLQSETQKYSDVSYMSQEISENLGEQVDSLQKVLYLLKSTAGEKKAS